MATIITNDDFVNACNWLIAQGLLIVTGARFIDKAARKIYDEVDHIDGGGKKILLDITPDIATLEAALDSQTGIINEEEQQNADSQVTHEQIKSYLLTQLVNPSPNLATIKTTIQSNVAGNVRVEQAIDNVAALFGFDTATDAGYVRSALLVISILT